MKINFLSAMVQHTVTISVADPVCLSRIPDGGDPDFFPSPDPRSPVSDPGFNNNTV